jgi:hypothetical protein
MFAFPQTTLAENNIDENRETQSPVESWVREMTQTPASYTQSTISRCQLTTSTTIQNTSLIVMASSISGIGLMPRTTRKVVQ